MYVSRNKYSHEYHLSIPPTILDYLQCRYSYPDGLKWLFPSKKGTLKPLKRLFLDKHPFQSITSLRPYPTETSLQTLTTHTHHTTWAKARCQLGNIRTLARLPPRPNATPIARDLIGLGRGGERDDYFWRSTCSFHS